MVAERGGVIAVVHTMPGGEGQDLSGGAGKPGTGRPGAVAVTGANGPDRTDPDPPAPEPAAETFP